MPCRRAESSSWLKSVCVSRSRQARTSHAAGAITAIPGVALAPRERRPLAWVARTQTTRFMVGGVNPRKWASCPPPSAQTRASTDPPFLTLSDVFKM
eukprot:1190916-Prorocentrum_minimum.AAC.1